MSSLIRLVYASRSTFAPGAGHQGLDPGVARILAKSRKNNAERQIVGGLLFGDGFFLQCLEGDVQAIDTLYAKIEADPRHQDVRILARQPIDQRVFAAWSMKFVPGERALADLLARWGGGRFDPYLMSPEQIDMAVSYMLQQDEAAHPPAAEAEQSPWPSTAPGDLQEGDVATPATAPTASTTASNTASGTATPLAAVEAAAEPVPATPEPAQAPAARKPRSIWTWISVAVTWIAIAGMLYWDFH